jgi:hypothetical protein
MANTYTLIASNVLSSNTATVTFSSIPSTYTDLVVRFSARGTAASPTSNISFTLNNNGSAIYSYNLISNNNNSVFPYIQSSLTSFAGAIFIPAATATANTFGSHEIYIPSYTAATNKPLSTFAVAENNSTTDFDLQVDAQLFRSTTAISRIDISGSSFVAGSSFYIYGIKST